MKGLRTTIFLLIALLGASLAFNLYQHKHPRVEEVQSVTTVFERDTIIDYVYKTDTIYAHTFHRDTVYCTKVINDTVWIADIPRTYRDSTPQYDLTMEAVKLNWYRLDIHARDTVTVYDRSVVTNLPRKQSRWGFGAYAGPSYDIYNRQWGISVGVGLTFRIK